MPLTIKAPDVPLRLIPEPLTPSAFASFGTVIENPSPLPSGTAYQRSSDQSLGEPSRPSSDAIPANQGTALKYNDVTKPVNLYDRAPSRKPGKAVMNMFICTPRELLPDAIPAGPIGTTAVAEGGQSQRGDIEGLLPIKILERHPYTTQTFIPLGLPPSDRHTRYLVIVAPTLPLSRSREARPPPFPMPEPRKRRSLREVLSRARPPPFPENEPSRAPSNRKSRRVSIRQGVPDLQNLQAFIARGSQAVTYGAGTWHAPMVVLGGKVEFVVAQYSNGVTEEDCQEVEITADTVDSTIVVAIPKDRFQMLVEGELRAKL
ncbi:MAG: Ureidoglycolate lyase [Trichoglossum hirsutum]|jgi:ureidoglycolate lyase|nr:MAG: Ureidoglycolate lyase [Trichoglossum hirsutum]